MRIEHLPFGADAVEGWVDPSGRKVNWPVVYMLNGAKDVYVGETLNVSMRLKQHLKNPEKQHLKSARVIVDDEFNKSVCLDLESHLISLFAGDGTFRVLNRNDGITDADYFDRERYRGAFEEIFEALREEGLFAKTLPEIRNSDLFKLSPFKALNEDQEIAVVDILEGFFEDLDAGATNTVVVSGGPGTGKTIVAIFLLKILADIASTEPADDAGADSVFADFFVEDNRELLADFTMGVVVPQQSLRKSIRRVFKKVPGLDPSMVLSPLELVKSERHFDLLVVDEAHRLGRYGATMGMKDFREASEAVALPGEEWEQITHLDWILRRSTQQVLFMDKRQSVRPLDLSGSQVDAVLRSASASGRLYQLRSQMRVAAGSDYLDYIDAVLDGDPYVKPQSFSGYDLRFFESVRSMREAIFKREVGNERERGLARLVAGFAWEWVSKKKGQRSTPDIRIDGLELFWNRTATDWINSRTSLEEVGSIHTVQGYDLNYAGVIIGPDLVWDQVLQRMAVNRTSYHDTKGKSNSKVLGVKVDDAALLEMVKNVYRVLLTRGMRGTYVYVSDPALRERLRPFFSAE